MSVKGDWYAWMRKDIEVKPKVGIDHCYDLCKDFSSEPRWYGRPLPDKVDAMALVFEAMIQRKEGKQLSELDEVVKEAQAKWEPVVAELDKLIHMVRVRCSFCSYFHECHVCPIGKGRGEDGGKFCVEYWEISRQLPILRDLAKHLLDRVNLADLTTDCQHHKEAEITIAGDEARFFQCVGCGRHRTEEYL